MRELEKEEEMIRVGEPVRIELMRQPVATPLRPTGNLKSGMGEEDRRR
jgi:hypothetical protein